MLYWLQQERRKAALNPAVKEEATDVVVPTLNLWPEIIDINNLCCDIRDIVLLCVVVWLYLWYIQALIFTIDKLGHWLTIV